MTIADPPPAALKEQSYAVVRGLFDPQTAARLNQICERVLAQWRSAPRSDNPPVGPQANYMRHINDPEYHRGHPEDLAFLLNVLGAPQVDAAIHPLSRPTPSMSLAIQDGHAVAIHYSLTLDEFRERRFASFDSKDATAIVAHVATAEATHTLEIEKVGERQWDMSQPVEMAANDDRVRRLLGRVSALKAKDFESMESESDLARFGLDAPRLDVTVRFASRDPLQLKVGADSPSDNRYEELAYVRIEGDETVYVARRGLLEEFGQDPSELRNRRVVRMKATDVIAVDAELRADPDDDLEGEAGVRYAADEWFWKDGVPVPGSTPERVARALAELEVDAFIDDEPKSLGEYGLDDPRARAVLSDGEGNERVVLIGNEGEPWVDPEGHERPRLFVAIEGAAPVYLVDERALSVVKDMIREGNRKKKKDAEKAARRERIPSDAIPDDPEEGDGTEG